MIDYIREYLTCRCEVLFTSFQVRTKSYIEHVSHNILINNAVPGPGFYTFQLLNTSLNCRFSYQHHPCYYLIATFLHIEPSLLKTNMVPIKITQLESKIVSQTSILGSQRYCSGPWRFCLGLDIKQKNTVPLA